MGDLFAPRRLIFNQYVAEFPAYRIRMGGDTILSKILRKAIFIAADYIKLVIDFFSILQECCPVLALLGSDRLSNTVILRFCDFFRGVVKGLPDPIIIRRNGVNVKRLVPLGRSRKAGNKEGNEEYDCQKSQKRKQKVHYTNPSKTAQLYGSYPGKRKFRKGTLSLRRTPICENGVRRKRVLCVSLSVRIYRRSAD